MKDLKPESVFTQNEEPEEKRLENDTKRTIFQADDDDWLQSNDSLQDSLGEVLLGISDDESIETTNLLEVFRLEFLNIKTDMLNYGNLICTSNDEQQIRQIVNKYAELLERVKLATEAMGLNGLHRISLFLLENLALVAAMKITDRQKIAIVMDAWPMLVTNYLQTPEDQAACLSLANHFQEKVWPLAINGKNARELYTSLQAGLSEDIEDELQNLRQTVATKDDVALCISSNIKQELLEAFFIEAPGQAEQFTELVTQINGANNLLDNVKAAQRLAHTLKGSANLIGANGVANLTHHIEDILEYLAQNKMAPPKPLLELLQESADCLEIMIEALQGIGPSPSNSLTVLQGILDWANRIDKGEIRAEDINTISPNNLIEESSNVKAHVEMLRVPVHVVDEMLRVLGEVSIALSHVQDHNLRLQHKGKCLKQKDVIVQQQCFELENLVDIRRMSAIHRNDNSSSQSNDSFDPLEMDQYDELYETSHSVIESVADARGVSLSMQSELTTMDGLLRQQHHLNKELQQIVMTTRMIPVESIAPRLQRAVRQAAKITNKKVKLDIIGLELLIDSNVLNKLVDPLMHMLRNAVDHSIETIEERKTAEKQTTGLVTLTFVQSGNNVRIYCADDGKGLDYAQIKKTAILNGLIDKQQNLSKHDLGRLILKSGFSTRTRTTQLSGRGVGLDVVHTTILDLKGTLDIQAGKSNGTLFTLDLPISLVSNHSIVVMIDDEEFAIPTNSLEQILPSDVGRVSKVGQSSSYHHGENIYSVYSLRALIGGNSEINQKGIILIAKVDNGNIAISVDKVVNSYDLVTKNMGGYIKKINGISGVAVLGNGDVVPVLDIPDLLLAHLGNSRKKATSIETTQYLSPPQSTTHVLIVDDSLSMRKSLSQFVEDIGYHAIEARDGLEAAEILENQNIDIALVDMEMPRMNGIELTTHIRASKQYKNLPIIMITSRTHQKHRQKAQTAGVNHYLSKPYSEDALMNSMESLLPKAM